MLGLQQVFEPVLAQVDQRDAAVELPSRCAGEKHLPAVSDAGDRVSLGGERLTQPGHIVVLEH